MKRRTDVEGGMKNTISTRNITRRKEVEGISLIYLIGGTSHKKKETVSGSLRVKDDAAGLDGIGDIQLFTEVFVDALVLQF